MTLKELIKEAMKDINIGMIFVDLEEEFTSEAPEYDYLVFKDSRGELQKELIGYKELLKWTLRNYNLIKKTQKYS